MLAKYINKTLPMKYSLFSGMVYDLKKKFSLNFLSTWQYLNLT